MKDAPDVDIEHLVKLVLSDIKRRLSHHSLALILESSVPFTPSHIKHNIGRSCICICIRTHLIAMTSARIIDQDIQTAKAAERLLYTGLPILVPGDVHGDEVHVAGVCSSDPRAANSVDVGHDYPAALLSEACGDALTKARATAGHDGYLACEARAGDLGFGRHGEDGWMDGEVGIRRGFVDGTVGVGTVGK